MWRFQVNSIEIILPVNEFGQTWDCANTINSTGTGPRIIYITEMQMPQTTLENTRAPIITSEITV
jgi:hypothetical protein